MTRRYWTLWTIGAALTGGLSACSKQDDASHASPPSDAESKTGQTPVVKVSDATPREIVKASEEAPNLLIITIDTLRADHLGCYGYFRNTSPTIDQLAGESLFFEHCYTPMAQTLPTHTSIFTGMYPREHGIVANIAQNGSMYQPSPLIRTLAVALKDAGYDTAAFVSAEPVKQTSGINAGFNVWSEPEAKKVSADKTNQKVFRWLDKDIQQPFMMWVHYFDPHAKYDPPPPYDTMFTTSDDLEKYMKVRGFEDAGSKERWNNPSPNKVKESRESINLYDGEIAFTDNQIGELFKKLKDMNLWEDTVIVLTGDHGEGLGQHGLTGHGNIWQEQLHVPLMIRIPGKEPRRVSTRLLSIDILPTLLGLLPDVPPNGLLEQFTGQDIFSKNYDPEKPLYSQLPGTRKVMIQALTKGEWRYIMHPQAGDRLYHLTEDPFEMNNIIEGHPEKAREMRQALMQMVETQAALAQRHQAGQTVKMDESRLENLRALGYVETEDEDEGDYGDGYGYQDYEEDNDEPKHKKDKKTKNP